MAAEQSKTVRPQGGPTQRPPAAVIVFEDESLHMIATWSTRLQTSLLAPGRFRSFDEMERGRPIQSD